MRTHIIISLILLSTTAAISCGDSDDGDGTEALCCMEATEVASTGAGIRGVVASGGDIY